MEPLNIGTVLPLQLENEMRSSYMDYAMSVIVSRALPDVRDGLKPVHRRILYAMQEQGMTPGARYQKCAPIAAELLVDLEKNTVDFGDNYSATRQEPLVLPARLPNLMLNGSSGIAVGMTTNIPPHNLA